MPYPTAKEEKCMIDHATYLGWTDLQVRFNGLYGRSPEGDLDYYIRYPW